MAEFRHFCPTCEHKGNINDLCKTCNTDGTAVPSNYELSDKRQPKPEAKNTEAVNHPSHYSNGKYECIEVMTEIFGIEATQNFCVLNAFKYLWRGDHKGKKAEDIKKRVGILMNFSNWNIQKQRNRAQPLEKPIKK